MLGMATSEYVSVTPLRRLNEQAEDYWDGNWLECLIDLRAGAFTGRYRASLRADEFASFRGELMRLYESLGNQAVFASMEEWLSITVTGDGMGHFQAECRARDEAGVGNTLQFVLGCDQTEIPAMVRSLDLILEGFPVRGRPDA